MSFMSRAFLVSFLLSFLAFANIGFVHGVEPNMEGSNSEGVSAVTANSDIYLNMEGSDSEGVLAAPPNSGIC